MSAEAITIFYEDQGVLEQALRDLGVLVTAGGVTAPAPGFIYEYLGPRAVGNRRLTGVCALVDFIQPTLTEARIEEVRKALDSVTYKGTEPLAYVLGRPALRAPRNLRGRLRAEAFRRMEDGGFVTTDAAAKWLPSTSAFGGVLAAYSALGVDIPQGSRLEALDGTFYAINNARARTALLAYANARKAVIDALDANLAAVQAGTLTRLEDAVWPPAYTPPVEAEPENNQPR